MLYFYLNIIFFQCYVQSKVFRENAFEISKDSMHMHITLLTYLYFSKI